MGGGAPLTSEGQLVAGVGVSGRTVAQGVAPKATAAWPDHALFGRKATTDPAGSLSRMAASIAFASAA